MANKNIVEYLETNKNLFPLEVLLSQLHKSGYAESEIQEAVKLYGASPHYAGVAVAKRPLWFRVVLFIVGFLIGGGLTVGVAFYLFILLAFGSLSSLGNQLDSLLGFRPHLFFLLILVAGAVTPLSLFFFLRRRYRHLALGILIGLATALVILVLFILMWVGFLR